MRQIYSKIIKFFSLAIGLMILFFVTFLTSISIRDYTPNEIIELAIYDKSINSLDSGSYLSVLTWNMGYSGLGKEMDFFYDGGEMVRAGNALSEKYLSVNLDFLKKSTDADFIFLQEVDINSKRTYEIDQADLIRQNLIGFESCFAKNYDVSFVPLPPLNPMGKVQAGIMTFSKYASVSAFRHAYPNIATWPDKLFLLDRCFIITRYKIQDVDGDEGLDGLAVGADAVDGTAFRELVLINTHNSYYINEDSLRLIELNILKEVMIQEYEKGNYVIAGGDWNKFPPINLEDLGIDQGKIQEGVSKIDHDFLPSKWLWAFDPSAATNRELNTPYTERSKISIIDYFVCSPNVEIISTKTIDLNFENSDHNPVLLKFMLKGSDAQKFRKDY